MTTDTPRTDAVTIIASDLQKQSIVVCRAISQQLERELAASKAEVAEMRVALGDDGRRTHKEVLELATKAREWRTWKQKYMELRNAHIAEGQDPAGTIWEHADKLQNELKASKAEVDRLKERLNDCLSFTAFHGPVGATPDTAKLLEKRILATLNTEQ